MSENKTGLAALFSGMFGNVLRKGSASSDKAAPAPYAPTFKKPVGYGPNGYVNKYMNPDYFASDETAEWIMHRAQAAEKFERVAPGNEGPLYTCSELQWWLRFPDGLELNAGILAAYFTRNPEDQFPGLAESFMREYIALARREAQEEARALGTSTQYYLAKIRESRG